MIITSNQQVADLKNVKRLCMIRGSSIKPAFIVEEINQSTCRVDRFNIKNIKTLGMSIIQDLHMYYKIFLTACTV